MARPRVLWQLRASAQHAFAEFGVPELLAAARAEYKDRDVVLRDARSGEILPLHRRRRRRRQATAPTFIVVEGLEERQAARVAQKCVLTKAVFQVWGQGSDHQNACEEAFQRLGSTPDLLAPMLAQKSIPWRAERRRGGKTKSARSELLSRFSKVIRLVPNRIDLSKKRKCFILSIVEDYSDQKELQQVWFGRRLCEGCYKDVQKFNLQSRNYIGPTTMDAQLAHVMAIMGGVSSFGRSHTVLDPFCGSAGLLLAATACAPEIRAFGTDVDPAILGGLLSARPAQAAPKSTRRKLATRSAGADAYALQLVHDPKGAIAKNFEQFGLAVPRLEVQNVIAAVDKQDSRLAGLLSSGPFDAIITDPPYGHREGMGRGQSKLPTAQAAVSALLRLAARTLRSGGRLVFFLPTESGFDISSLQLPSCFRLEFCSRQRISPERERILLTLVYNSASQRGAAVAWVPPPGIGWSI